MVGSIVTLPFYKTHFMIGNQLNQALEYLTEAHNKINEALNRFEALQEREGGELEDAEKLIQLKDDFESQLDILQGLANKFNCSFNNPVTKPIVERRIYDYQKNYFVSIQDKVLDMFHGMFGKKCLVLYPPLVLRLLDVCYFQHNHNSFKNCDKEIKPLVIGLIGLCYMKTYKAQLEVHNGKLCAILPKFNIRIHFEKHLSGRGDKEEWLRTCNHHILNFAKDSILIPADFEGIEFY